MDVSSSSLSSPPPVSPAKAKVDPNTNDFKPDILDRSAKEAKAAPPPTDLSISDEKSRPNEDGKLAGALGLVQSRSYESANPRKVDSYLSEMNLSSSLSQESGKRVPSGPDGSDQLDPSCRSESTASTRSARSTKTGTTERPDKRWDETSAKAAVPKPSSSLASPVMSITATETVTVTHPEELVDTLVTGTSIDSEAGTPLTRNVGPIHSGKEDQHGVVKAEAPDVTSSDAMESGPISQENAAGSPVPPCLNDPPEKSMPFAKESEDDGATSLSSVRMMNPWLMGSVEKKRAELNSNSRRSNRSERISATDRFYRSDRSGSIKASADSVGSGDRRPNNSRGSEISRRVASDLVRLENQLSAMCAKERELVRSSTTGSSDAASMAGTTVTSSSRSSARSHTSSKYSIGRTRLDVTAPKGRLGIILANRSDGHGTVVSDVRTSSVLAGKILPGDRIIAIDGSDVSGLPVSKITEIMGAKANFERVLTIITPSNGGRRRALPVPTDIVR
mmetsp:Transcript_15438/g.22794  ORF Transcript_15438/g.22794 Transcript_15438/m.22794 type:complete len:506 (-) Transcript_15438:42-1559(-)